MRFRKRQRVELTDYRKVSELVHEHRAERARNSEMLRENAEAAEATVRTYSPEERLHAVDRETRQLVEDSRDIPRTWDSEFSPPDPLRMETHYLFLLAANLFLVPILFAGFLPELKRLADPTPLDFVGFSLPLVVIALVTIPSFVYFQILGRLAWVGLFICAVELAVFVVLVSWLR
jgi:hypothetical protein